ncbi:unnamed protein product [Penicillium olsonii]|nr:unnamed protein product [Penicillium olsonii]CAG7919841.1 unnamed protein product [Penicillium olsonii]
MFASPSTPPSEPTLQKATIDDIPTIKAMVDKAYSIYIERMGKKPAPMSEDWERTLQTHDVLNLKESDLIVGSITFHIEHDLHALKIDNVVVNPATQGRGYGRFLIRHAEMEARQRGIPTVTLYTNAKMVENIGMYKKLGFEETGTIVEDGFERVYFHKCIE